MKRRKSSIPIVIDLVSSFPPKPQLKVIRTPSVIDLTNSEPDTIVVDRVVKPPQTRSEKRKSQSRSSSVSENEVMVLSSNFPLKKKRKSSAVTPKIGPKPAVVSSKKKKKSAAKKRKSVNQANKKTVAKSKRKLADISNIASNQSKQSKIKSPAPLSKAANDYYSKITKAINENKKTATKKRKSRSPDKRERIIRTVINEATTTNRKQIPSKASLKNVPRSTVNSNRNPSLPRHMIRNGLMQQKPPAVHTPEPSVFPQNNTFKSHAPKPPVFLQNNPFETHRQLFLTRSFGQNAPAYNPRPQTACIPENGLYTRRRREVYGNLQSRLKQENFNNFYNPNPINVEEEGFRPIVIDGSNVACGHGHGVFSPKGLQICVDFFNKRGMDRVKVFLPQSKQRLIPADMLEDLRSKCEVVFTPARNVNGVIKICYDDRFIVQYANEVGGIIVSTDNYRDLVDENPTWKHVIQTRLLMFSWVDDLIMFPKDPLGKDGPTLQEFLRF